MRFSKSVKKVFYYFLFSRALVVLFAFLGKIIFPLEKGYLGNQIAAKYPYLIWIWANFDGRHFLEIATIGYQRYNYVFLPLYPSIIYLLGRIFFIPSIFAGIFISLISLFLGVLVFQRLADLDLKTKSVDLAVILLLIFPTSYYLQSVYSTSLTLVLILTSFFMARKGKWFWSSFSVSLAVVSHITALALIPALAAEWLGQKRKPLKFIPHIVLSLSGLAVYSTYLQLTRGKWLLFMSSYYAWGREKLVFPPQDIYRYLKIFFVVSPKLLVYWVAVLEFSIFALCLVMAIYVTRKIRISYGVFIFSLLLISSLSGSFIGIPRYTLYMFPIFIGMAAFLSKHRITKAIVITIFVVLEFLLTSLFTRGYFIA